MNEVRNISESNRKRKPRPQMRWMRWLTIAAAILAVAGAGLAQAQTPNVVGWGNNAYGQISPPASLTDAKAIAAGFGHSLALKGDGTVVAWGKSTEDQTIVPAGLAGVTAIAAGSYHSLALKSDGTVAAWGSNSDGQINVPTGLAGVTAIAAGLYHSLALKSDGTVVAWGSNGFGQTNVPSGLAGVTAIAAGYWHNLAVKNDGTVVAWGYNYDAQTDVPSGLAGVTAIAAGRSHSLALKSDGTVVAWGSNAQGQTSVPSGLAGVTAIAASEYHSVALKGDGTVVAWGENLHGESSVPSGLAGVSAIAAGTFHTLALKAVGSPVAWGDNSGGHNSTPASLTDAKAIADGSLHSLALKSDGTVVAWGNNSSGQASVPSGLAGVTAIAAGIIHSLALKSDGTVVVWGDNTYGQTSVPSGLSGVTAIAAGQTHNLALKSDGTVAAWGDNYYRQASVPSGLTGVTAIAAGAHHSLALKSNGTVVGWGDNSYGQTSVPSGLSGVTDIAAGGFHNMALKSGGTVVAWGFDYYGQASVPAGLAGVTAIAAGGYHSLALKQSLTQPVIISSSIGNLTFSVTGTGCQPGSYTTSATLQWTPGSSCTVTFASPQSGATGTRYAFTEWADGSTDNPRTFTAPSAAATYTANFKTQYLLTTQANPTGYGTVSGGGVYNDAGSNADVFASPNTGYAFQNWTGPVASSTSSSTTVAMTAPQSVTANFIALTPVTIQTSPTGLSFTLDSQTYNATYLFYWKPGETHTIAVATPLAGASGTQYVWNNWSDSGAISHTVTAPSTATTYTAGFTTKYYLTTAVGIGGSAAGSISPAGGYVNAGASVSTTATANSGYAFTGFSGDLSGSTNPGSITMNAPHSVTANFGLLSVLSVASESRQYSDPVTPSATIAPPGLAVSGTLQFAVNGVNLGGPVTVNGAGTYSAPTSYVITQGQGTYTGAITAVFTSTTVGVLGSSGAGNLVVSRENATVTLSTGNPVSVQVSAPGGTASSITLMAAIQEPADGNPGDIAKALPVTLRLIPVVAAPTINCPAITSVAAQILTATFSCANVPVNVYDVAISIGGNYYTGIADSVLVVYDPSLGFVTGGGIIVHNGVPANFGINVKYLKNGQIQGGMLYIEHRSTGDLILKSNALTGLSIVGNTAVLVSKATLNGAGSYALQATAIDNGQPGTSDQFGLQVTGPSGTVPDLTFAPVNLAGGNLQVPHSK